MISRQRIESKIRQKDQEIQDLEMSLREAKSYLHALQDMLKLLPREENDRTAEHVLRPGSEMEKVRNAIKSAGKSLHIAAILESIGKENTKKNRVSIAGSLAAYARKKQIFNRPAPNTFGLIKPNNKELEGDLPEDFGK